MAVSQIKSLQEDKESPAYQENYSLKGKALYWKSRLYVPEGAEIIEIIKDFHDNPHAGHYGRTKTLKSISNHYMWPGMKKDLFLYLKGCKTCGRTNPSRSKPQGLLKPLGISEGPWKLVSLDFIVELPNSAGHNAMLVIVDRFKKLAHFLPTTTGVTAQETFRLFMENVFLHHSIPNEIVSDQGPQFTSKFWEKILKDLKVKRSLSSAHHPQLDGKTKRVNQVYEQYMQCYINKEHNNWSKLLKTAQFAYNNTHHASI